MRVNPITPANPAKREARPAWEVIDTEPRAKRTEPASAPQTRASVALELYGNPATFGAFPCYGTFSEKV